MSTTEEQGWELIEEDLNRQLLETRLSKTPWYCWATWIVIIVIILLIGYWVIGLGNG